MGLKSRWGPAVTVQWHALIDRLNYRDIGVIKAPLCQDPFLEGVDETRDWTPGVMTLSSPSPPSAFHLFLLVLRFATALSLPRAARQRFVNKPLSARRCGSDESPRIPRFRCFQSRRRLEEKNSGTRRVAAGTRPREKLLQEF